MEEQKPCVGKNMNICLENLCWYITAYGLFHHGFMYRRQASCSQLEALKMETHEWPSVELYWHLWWESQCLACIYYHLLSQRRKTNTPGKEFDLWNHQRNTDTTLLYGLQQRPHIYSIKKPPYFREFSSLVVQPNHIKAKRNNNPSLGLANVRKHSFHLLWKTYCGT